MPKPPPGWYVYLGHDGDRVAMDKFGPFDTRQDVVDWMTEHGIRYTPNAEAYDRAVLTWSEMTGDEVDSSSMFGTAIHSIVGA